VSADVNEIADAIRSGGLGEIKAGRIKQALIEIRQQRGRLELDFLNDVGTKTANCVFLFSLRRPALPVDTHVYRVAKRLGIIDARTTVEKAHRLLESLVPPEKVYLFHVLFIEHGRKVCKAPRPRCDGCVLSGLCHYFRQRQL